MHVLVHAYAYADSHVAVYDSDADSDVAEPFVDTDAHSEPDTVGSGADPGTHHPASDGVRRWRYTVGG
jgi:hypothetical protein